MSVSDTIPPDAALRRLYERILTAWNNRDASGMAAQFAKDGNIVGFDGSQVDSPTAIEAHLRPIFADHPTATYVAKVREVRMLGPEVGMLRAVAGMVPRGGHDINPALNTVHTLVGVREDDREWRAVLYQNTPAAWHGRPNDSAALTEELRDVMRRGLIIDQA